MPQCINPIRVRDEFGCYRFVPCGKCAYCLSRKHQQWIFRLQQESLHSKCTFVITLTYADEFLPLDNDGYAHLCKSDIQLYMRKLRKLFKGKKIRYFIVGEYSPTNFRPHYHGIIFFPNDYLTLDEFYMNSFEAWRKSEKFTHRPDITSGEAINYVAKYVQKLMEVPEFLTPPFALMSRKPGIGSRYLFDENGDYRKEVYQFHKFYKRAYSVIPGGAKVCLPRYYKDTIFSKTDKEIIRLENLELHYPRAFELIEKLGRDRGAKQYFQEYEDFKKRQLNVYKNKRKL